MTKDKLLKLIDQEWSSFITSFEGLDGNALQKTDVVGSWSIRDIMVHITTWEEQALEALPLILSNIPVRRYTRYGGIDGFNAVEQARKKAHPLSQVKDELSQMHQKLVNYLLTISEDTFKDNKRFTKRLYWDAYGHYREHTKQIISWRQKQGL